MDDFFNAYEVLGCEPQDSVRTIHKLYRLKIEKIHPDHAKDPEDARQRTEATARLNRAHTILMDPAQRARLDLEISRRTGIPVASVPLRTPPVPHRPRPAPMREPPFTGVTTPSPSASTHDRRVEQRRNREIGGVEDLFVHTHVGQWVTLIGACAGVAFMHQSWGMFGGDVGTLVVVTAAIGMFILWSINQGDATPLLDSVAVVRRIARLVIHWSSRGSRTTTPQRPGQ